MYRRELWKAILVGGLSITLSVGAALFQFEFWPLTNYPMFSTYPENGVLPWPKLVTENGIVLNQDIDVWPLDTFRFYAIVQDLIYAKNFALLEKLINSIGEAQQKEGIPGSRLHGEIQVIEAIWNVRPGFKSIKLIEEFEVLKTDLRK